MAPEKFKSMGMIESVISEETKTEKPEITVLKSNLVSLSEEEEAIKEMLKEEKMTPDEL